MQTTSPHIARRALLSLGATVALIVAGTGVAHAVDVERAPAVSGGMTVPASVLQMIREQAASGPASTAAVPAQAQTAPATAPKPRSRKKRRPTVKRHRATCGKRACRRKLARASEHPADILWDPVMKRRRLMNHSTAACLDGAVQVDSRRFAVRSPEAALTAVGVQDFAFYWNGSAWQHYAQDTAAWTGLNAGRSFADDRGWIVPGLAGEQMLGNARFGVAPGVAIRIAQLVVWLDAGGKPMWPYSYVNWLEHYVPGGGTGAYCQY
jgi:hypothetical protein